MKPLKEYLKVFISHSWHDKDTAEELFGRLSEFFAVWMDNRQLRAGDRIQERIDSSALPETDVVVLLWSANAKGSPGVHAEISRALELDKRIIPCVVSYDEQGNPSPPLPQELAGVLSIDFRNPAHGTAELLENLVYFRDANLPEEVRSSADDTELVGSLRRFLQFSRDRERRDAGYDRERWTSEAIDRMERYVREQSPELASTLAEIARRNQSGDPAFAQLLKRMEDLATDVPVRARPDVRSAAKEPAQTPELRGAPAPDELARRVTAVVPAGTADQWVSLVDQYIQCSPGVLQALAAFASATGSAAGAQVVNALNTYLQNPDDFIPDTQGRFGLTDDAWLIVNTALRLVEAGILPLAQLPLNWDVVRQVDHVVRAILPPAVLAGLEGILLQLMQLIAAEVSSYQPWFTPNDAGGYNAFFATPSNSGGCWEDQMNQGLLGTGLSV